MTNHTPPCDELVKCKDDTKTRLTNIETQQVTMCQDISDIKDSVTSMSEIINTWNNGKGFINTIRILSKLVLWFGAITAAIAGTYHYLKHMGH